MTRAFTLLGAIALTAATTVAAATSSGYSAFLEPQMSPRAIAVDARGASVATGGLFDAFLIAGSSSSTLPSEPAPSARARRRSRRSVRPPPSVPASGATAEEAAVDAEELVPGDVIQLLPGRPDPRRCPRHQQPPAAS